MSVQVPNSVKDVLMWRFVRLAALVLASGLVLAQTQDPTVPIPSNIKVEGMPAIPQSIADGFARYAQFRQALLMGWHPTKRQILIATSFSTNPPLLQFHFLDGPGRERRQLTWIKSGLPSTVDASFDPADVNTFVFPSDPGGGEFGSLYRYDLATGETTLVTQAQMRYAPVWAHEGKWLAYDSKERDGKDRDLYVIEPSDPSTKRRLGDFDGSWVPQDWSPDGTALLVIEFPTNEEAYLWTVDVKTGAKKAITQHGGSNEAWYSARFSSDGKKIYAVGEHGGESPRLWRCDVANCQWTAVSPEGVALDLNVHLALSSDGSLAAYAADRGSATDLQVIDLTALKLRPLPDIPKGTVTRIAWRPHSREVGFTLGSVRSQGDAYSVDTSLGTLTQWTTSETTFNADSLPTPEVISWKSFDGQTISGILYRPSSKFTGPRPVEIYIHGGPDQHEYARWQGRSNYQLNELGMAIIAPNVRGSSGFGRRFADLDNGGGREGAIKDIGALLDSIATRPDLDKSRVVLVGPSYGGWLALEAGIVYNDRIRGIIEGAGVTNFATFLEQTDPARQDNRRQEYGDERDADMRKFLLSISPITRAAELKKPTLIVQAGKDPRVPVDQGRELVAALKANNATVWYEEVTNGNHENFGALGGDYVLYSWELFFKTFVLN
jgi:dipeptidyl aminopeptidase/acylaminoacyl peptidase